MRLQSFYEECRIYADEHTPDVLGKILEAPIEDTEDIIVKTRRKSSKSHSIISYAAAAALMSISIIFIGIHFGGLNNGNKIVPEISSRSPYSIVYAMQEAYDSIENIEMDGKVISTNVKTNAVLSDNSWKEIFAGPLENRYETQDFVRIVNGNKSWNYYKYKKRVEIIPSDPSGSPFLALKSKLDDIVKNDNYKLIGSEKINGINANIIQVKTAGTKNDSWTDTYWVDKKTNLILKQENIHGDVKTVTSYKINSINNIDKGILKPDFPADVTVIDRLNEFEIFYSITDAQKAASFDIVLPIKIPDDFKLFKIWKYKKDEAIEIDYYNKDYTKFVFIRENKDKDRIIININSNMNEEELKSIIEDLKTQHRNIILTVN